MKRCFAAFAFLTLATPAFAGEVPEKALEEQARPAGAVSEVTLAGCLPASAYVKIPVKAGQKVFVTSKIAAPCDSRGWTNGNGLAFYGPTGSGTYQALAAGPNTPMG
ncbi:hypothetical protein [Bradyrhizobium sp. CCBAU 051011]|uniref:hypothetical protein n=1 Tax=Bradyrhizobium sp. CCBAU 051011 TaxID=858422 RepID=UPI001AEE4C63|nr:hypothetical protein [Bradyrhizobium sp. CCBAU 051011]